MADRLKNSGTKAKREQNMKNIMNLRIYLEGAFESGYDKWNGAVVCANRQAGMPGSFFVDVEVESLLLNSISNKELLAKIGVDKRVVGASQKVYLDRYIGENATDGNIQAIYDSKTISAYLYVVWGSKPVDVFNFCLKAIGYEVVEIPKEYYGYSSYVAPEIFKPTIGDIMKNTFGKWFENFKKEIGIKVYPISNIKTFDDFCKAVGEEYVVSRGYNFAGSSSVKAEHVGRDIYVYLEKSDENEGRCLGIFQPKDFEF